MSKDDFINENYTFTKDTIINNELDSSLSYDFFNKNNLPEVLRSCLEFLQSSGYPYVTKLVAVKEDGEELASDDDISEEIIEVLNTVVEELDTIRANKRKESKPKLEVVVSNDEENNSTDST